MFTGIVEKTGRVTSVSSNRVQIHAGLNVKLGDSVCVNGACLTVSDINGDVFSFDVSNESQSISTLKKIKVNDIVNLERAMPADGRFGGHFVTGHVDSVGKVSKVVKDGTSSIDMYIEFDKEQAMFLVNKGSVCVNGVSLTVNEVKANVFRLTLIPYTLKETNLLELKAGDTVNVEFDVLAKYVANMLNPAGTTKEIKRSTLTEEKLRSLGYVK